MTLYAGWTINVYTLTLDANGGSLDYGKETVAGDYNTVPEIPVPLYPVPVLWDREALKEVYRKARG